MKCLGSSASLSYRRLVGGIHTVRLHIRDACPAGEGRLGQRSRCYQVLMARAAEPEAPLRSAVSHIRTVGGRREKLPAGSFCTTEPLVH